MRNPETEDDDVPLDPATQAVAQKIRRLTVLSTAILAVGLIAVFGAILYKSLGRGGSGVAKAPTAELPLLGQGLVADGHASRDLAVDGDRLFILTEGRDGAAQLIYVDIPSWSIVGRMDLTQP